MQLNQRKAAIIGCGFVGSATAFCLMQSGLFSEIVLQDVDKEKQWILHMEHHLLEE